MELHRGIARLRAGRKEAEGLPSGALKPATAESTAAAPFCVSVSAADEDDSLAGLYASHTPRSEDQNERLRLFEELPQLLSWDSALDFGGLPGMGPDSSSSPGFTPTERLTLPDSDPLVLAPSHSEGVAGGREKRLKRSLEPDAPPAIVGASGQVVKRLPEGFLDSRRTLSASRVTSVAIVGGTHGNEKNGVALTEHFIAHPELISRPSFEAIALVANPAAVAANARYVEEDLNRCFLATHLSDPDTYGSLEHRRARELYALLGPKLSQNPAADFIIDIHCTTASTGVALMMAPNDAFAHEVGNYLMELDPAVVIVEWNGVPSFPPS